jgi:hypothetical protein
MCPYDALASGRLSENGSLPEQGSFQQLGLTTTVPSILNFEQDPALANERDLAGYPEAF